MILFSFEIAVYKQELLISMGSQNSKFLSDQELPHEYRPLKQLPNVYQSILNGTRLQKHKIDLNSEAEINYQKQIFVFRRMHADRVISAYFFQKFMPSHFCNMSYQVCFFTQYPAYGLTIDLVYSTQRCFQLLIECLKGFQILYSKFGAFNVTFSNIYFNSHHQPKVWISNDLGKTKFQRNKNCLVTESHMLTQIFRLFDQIKDERNSKIAFSNYLRRLQQKQLKSLTFKNVIMYMVDEASKYFLCRTRTKPFLQLEKTQINQTAPNNPSIMTAIKSKSPNSKQNSSNVISLKTKTKVGAKNTCTSGQFISLCTAVTNQSDGFGKIARATHADKVKKSKRHNSQQDCKTRQIHFFRQIHNTNFCGEGLRIVNPRNGGIDGQISPNNQSLYHNPSTIRVFRRSLDQLDNVYDHQIEDKTMRTVQKCKIEQQLVHQHQHQPQNQNQPQHHHQHQHLQQQPRPRNAYNIIQTQIQKQQQHRPHIIKIPKTTFTYPQHQPSLKSVQVRDKQQIKIVKTVSNEVFPIGSPSKDFNQSNMILSNLQTLKSIVNSQYSDLDSQIRDDLENMHY